MAANYVGSDKMFELICDEYHLLQMLSRFDISLGFGEKSIQEVCEENGVHCITFLAVANYIKNGSNGIYKQIEDLSLPTLIAYLTKAHAYFLDFQLPAIRRKLIEAIDCSMKNEVAFLILKFFDEYMNEVRKHMEFENEKVFTYVKQLLEGKRKGNYEVAVYARNHESVEIKLMELKNIIIKYYTPQGDSNQLNAVLFDIFNCAADLESHCSVEDALFVPAVQLLESQVESNTLTAPETVVAKKGVDALSEREKEIVVCVVKGLSNKEIAEQLFISVNTVLTHRKNISRKLQIHSVSGLTIYAIVNQLVNIEEVQIS